MLDVVVMISVATIERYTILERFFRSLAKYLQITVQIDEKFYKGAVVYILYLMDNKLATVPKRHARRVVTPRTKSREGST